VEEGKTPTKGSKTTGSTQNKTEFSGHHQHLTFPFAVDHSNSFFLK
jgi:hypothetical protein